MKNINIKEDYPTVVNGRTNKYLNQRLFWDKIKFEVPKSPKIKLKEDEFLIQFYHNKIEKLDKPVELGYLKTNGLTRNDKETAEKALKQIKIFARLLALRDQECPDSRGYEFIYGYEQFVIFRNINKVFSVKPTKHIYSPTDIYFKTKEDAQRICNILNSGRFDLEGK